MTHPFPPRLSSDLLFFVLEYYGHTRTRLLNGGLGKWRREGRALTAEVPAIAPKRFVPRARRDLAATAEEVKTSLGKEERSEEHTSELQPLMRISYAVFCLKKKTTKRKIHTK